jgi:hypothetical protein
MVLKLVIFLIIGLVLIGIFGNFSPVATMTGSVQSLYTSVTTAALAGELTEIRNVINEFLVLRQIRSSDEGELLAEELDHRINNLQLVKMHCNEKISTLDLAYEKNPYEKIQQLCPTLKNLSFSKAAQLFRLI